MEYYILDLLVTFLLIFGVGFYCGYRYRDAKSNNKKPWTMKDTGKVAETVYPHAKKRLEKIKSEIPDKYKLPAISGLVNKKEGK